MSIPGFTAVASLDRTGGHYHASGAFNPSSGVVAPQLIDPIGTICGPCLHGIRMCHVCTTHAPFSCHFFTNRC
jgi:hypothetical protein